MALTNAGRDFITQVIANDGSPVFFNSANSHIGVGDSTTAFVASQTDLQASSNKTRKGMEAGFPTRTNNQLVFKSSFGTTEANFAWQEWGVFNASSGGVMLNRKVENLGTKSGGNWLLTVTLTINIS